MFTDCQMMTETFVCLTIMWMSLVNGTHGTPGQLICIDACVVGDISVVFL